MKITIHIIIRDSVLMLNDLRDVQYSWDDIKGQRR